jgi:hypothetical protein
MMSHTVPFTVIIHDNRNYDGGKEKGGYGCKYQKDNRQHRGARLKGTLNKTIKGTLNSTETEDNSEILVRPISVAKVVEIAS